MQYKNFSFFILCVLLTTSIFGQIDRPNLPYSYFALGEHYQEGFAFNRALGNTGIAMHHSRLINTINPASHSKMDRTILATGMNFDRYKINSVLDEQKASQFNIAYIAVGIPLKDNWGLSFALKPYSITNYFVAETDDTGDAVETKIYNGEGNIYQFQMGSGYAIGNDSTYTFRFGANGNLNFGSIDHRARIDSVLIEEYYGSRKKVERQIIGFSGRLGVQFDYNAVPEKDLWLTVGAIYDLKGNLNVDRTFQWDRFRTVTNLGSIDSIQQIDSIPVISRTFPKEKLKLPASLGIGVAIQQPGKWFFTMEYRKTNYSEMVYPESNSELYVKDESRFNTGLSFTPNENNLDSFWSSVTYNLGFYSSNGSLRINDTDIKEYAFTGGFGIPISRRQSRLNFSFEIGQKGEAKDVLVKQTFYKTTVGFSLTDKWFIKRKFD